MEINDIIAKYTAGEADLPTTNEALKKAGSIVLFDPMKNALTPQEILSAKGGAAPTGFGIMDDGIGVYKAEARDGKMVNRVFDPAPNFHPGPYNFIIAGETYRVADDGESLVHAD